MKYSKIYQGFKPKADMLLNYQLCKAYLNENGGVFDIVEKILSEKFGGLHIKDRLVIRALRGKRNPVIELPYHEFKATEEDILSEFVSRKFDKMVNEVKAGKEGYPLVFRDMIERFEE
jgi:hypothetical protein